MEELPPEAALALSGQQIDPEQLKKPNRHASNVTALPNVAHAWVSHVPKELHAPSH
jgi:hypothetical protein